MSTPEQNDVPQGSQVPVEVQPAAPAAAPAPSGDTAVTPIEAGKPLGDSAPSLESLQAQECPNCHTGVLYVTRYDPNATHEQGQDLSAANQVRSGGAYQVYCFNCTYSESRSLNPESAA